MDDDKADCWDAILEADGVGVAAASVTAAGVTQTTGTGSFPNSIDGILASAELVVSGLNIPTALTDMDLQQVLRVMKIANVFGVVDPRLWAALCGVPTIENPWGETIANGIVYWAAEYFRKAPQGHWLQGVDVHFGWFLLPENWSRHNSQLPPGPNDRFYYPCVYVNLGGSWYMICIHLLIVLARKWWVHGDRLTEWNARL